MSNEEAPTVVDLFCGAGGLALGFTEAGFKIVLARDANAAAVATYRRNVGDHVAEEEIHAETALPEADVFIGGPPCQGFSSAGMRRPGDARNTLVSAYAKLIARHRPTAFVFENVEGFLTGEDGARVLDLLDPVIEVGYHVHLRKVNAANYGVPQHRKRVVAIGGLGWSPTFPAPTHAAYGAPGAQLVGRHLPPTPPLSSALDGLPAPAANAPGVPPGHFTGKVGAKDLERLRALGPGQSMRDLPEDLWHETFSRRAHRRVQDGTPTERRGGAPHGIRRLRADQPSKAITSMTRAEFVHPVDDRFLTLRECARIQGFADEFVFEGSQAEQATIIGNAVPPRLAFALAASLRADLAAARRRTGVAGKLLSFVPTESTGMSPALARITAEVRARFMSGPEVPIGGQVGLWG
ncbi:MAG: DNA cytosine methyltransferase [Deltaproteobacteria bacterium]|nr:DNA cytosine methyltransferase [Deltaproteobacteria bacterium]